ncbi:hypothetical protein B5E77_08025 [Lachnoclostridium sp. An131]|jgi:foldase protein PrsA|uniref:peptidylprolyl isomerase n=1 Tax=Lachnoclostridium sp. An131 TaxID=1965555 RepID=UPI000B371519|nr:peptidylprolyl isomerase [Lachnoclostridium sp. An131]OUQ27100.1 hypothetical protein B5E77_08025 [Lachnoclostridium sp. An131]
MAKGIRKKLAVLLAAAVMAGSFSGCGLMENTEIVFTTGLSGEQLFKIGKSVCTLPEAMIYVMDYQRQYEGVYGVEMWEHDFGGITFENYVKDTIVDQLASMKAITLLAGDYEVSLSSDEEEKVSQAAEDYYGALTEEQIEYMDLELKDVESLYRDHALSGKVYEEITKDVNTEVSDDEARIITVQQIRLDSAETAQSVKEQLDEGRDFAAVASSYSLDSQVTYTFGRGEHDAAYEEAAFALENDQVSDVIETEDGYYILKCVNNFDQEATEDNKVTMVEKRRDELFESVYEKLVADTPSQFNSRLWEKVHFADWTGEMPPDFLAIYEEYLGA